MGIGYSKVSLLYSSYDEERLVIYNRLIDYYKEVKDYNEVLKYLELEVRICKNKTEEKKIREMIKEYENKMKKEEKESEENVKEKEEEKKEAELIKKLTIMKKFSSNTLMTYYQDYAKAFEYVNQENYKEVFYIKFILNVYTVYRHVSIFRKL